MRYWIKFAKAAELRFISHLDLMRAWQRTLRRARLPVAFSLGYNPHPRLSFASALPVGATSEAEYLDIFFTRLMDEADFSNLQAVLPEGLQVLGWREVPHQVPALMSLVVAAQWHVPVTGQDTGSIATMISQVTARETLQVTRPVKGKKEKKAVNIRPHILQLSLCGQDQPMLHMLLRTGKDGGVKPREVLALLNLPEGNSLHRVEIYLAAGKCLQPPLDVLLNKNEVAVDAEKNYYQL